MKTCSILGHRTFKKTKELELKTKEIITFLIEKEGVTEFLFSSKSRFVDFCYDIITELKAKYFNLNRVFVRAEYPIIDEEYSNYLKTLYEDTYFYSKKLISNKFSYIRRNQTIIDKSDFCIFYYNNEYAKKCNFQSGTRLSYDYAIKKKKKILNVFICS